MAFAIAAAQHTASVILLPAVLIVYAHAFWREPWRRRLGVFASGMALAAAVGGFFYVSLLWLPTDHPWPDWGRLTTLRDVWNHLIRQDYGITTLHRVGGDTSHPAFGIGRAQQRAENAARGFGFSGAWVLAPSAAGLFFSRHRLAGRHGVFALPRPAAVFRRADRYRFYRALPNPGAALFDLFFAGGVHFLYVKLPRRAGYALGAGLAVLLGVYIEQGLNVARRVDNDLVEIYRQEVAREFPAGALFLGTSDLELFYAIPCGGKICYPLQSLFVYDWYREGIAPRLEPRWWRSSRT